jgi:Uma2 family endonuclease
VDTAELQRPGSWRFDQLDGLPDDGRRYEVVDGLLVVSPPPSPWHQVVATGLLLQLTEQAAAGGASFPSSGSRWGRTAGCPTSAW